MTANEFIAFVKKECKYFGVKLLLPKTRQVRCMGSFCSGYFEPQTQTLRVAKNGVRFLEVLAHEYCHILQWIEKHETSLLLDEQESSWKLMKWLEGKEVEDIEYHIDIIRDVELDNEKRVAALIRKMNLPINPREYTRRANAYLMSYNWMKKSRKWRDVGGVASRNNRLLAALPDKFSLNYTKLPRKIEKIFAEENL